MSVEFYWFFYRTSSAQAAGFSALIDASMSAAQLSPESHRALAAWRDGADVLDGQIRDRAEPFARAFHEPWPTLTRRPAPGEGLPRSPVQAAVFTGWSSFVPSSANARVIAISLYPPLALLAYALGPAAFDRLPLKPWSFALGSRDVARARTRCSTVPFDADSTRWRGERWARAYGDASTDVGELLGALPLALTEAQVLGEALASACVGQMH